MSDTATVTFRLRAEDLAHLEAIRDALDARRQYMHKAKLRKGAVVRLRLTHPRTVSRIYQWVIRAPKPPLITRRCLEPGPLEP